MNKVPKLHIEGISDELKDVAYVLLYDNVPFQYKDNTIITEGLYNPYRKQLIENLNKYIKGVKITEK